MIFGHFLNYDVTSCSFIFQNGRFLHLFLCKYTIIYMIVAQATITFQPLRHGHLRPLYRIGHGLQMCMENQNSCFRALFANYSLMIF
jgi:hypothetical protein